MIDLIMQVRILPTDMDQALRIIKTSITPTPEHKEGFLGLFTMAHLKSFAEVGERGSTEVR